MEEVVYNFTYFQKVRGRLEPIRLMFEEKKVKYNLNLISINEWKDEKSKYEFGQLPYYEEIRKEKTFKMSQSHAIYRR
jgi:hypothetical protein